MKITDCTLEPYSFESGHQLDPYTKTEFYIKFMIDGVWYKSDKHYGMDEALKIRDKWRVENGFTDDRR